MVSYTYLRFNDFHGLLVTISRQQMSEACNNICHSWDYVTWSFEWCENICMLHVENERNLVVLVPWLRLETKKETKRKIIN